MFLVLVTPLSQHIAEQNATLSRIDQIFGGMHGRTVRGKASDRQRLLER
jgi:hypothetical protein